MKFSPITNFGVLLVSFFSRLTYILAFISAMAFTIISILKIIVNTTNQFLWVQITNIVEAIIFFGILMNIFEIALVKFLPWSPVFKNISIHLQQRASRTHFYKNAESLLVILFIFNIHYAQHEIWHGDGHGIYGTWISFAGSVSLKIIALSVLSLILQDKVQEIILKKYKNS